MTIAPVRPEASTVDADLFRRLLRHHAASAVVITAAGSPPAGFTATSFTSVSLDPPLVSFSLSRTASAWPTVEHARTIAVHVLGHEHEHIARTFATSGIDRFAAGVPWEPGPDGVPLLDGVPARLICRVTDRIAAGDHTIVLAAPIAGQHADNELTPPLVYHAGRYGTLHHGRHR
ncbi:flavin reductase family protein [Dactylosporangium sp. NPDC000555]|uniref:flavin reductase family protein n=1 Tax=Dactylosporangium sp. NPDC000555 TaxID=3154260 RepID=UPI00332C1C71